MARTTLPKAFGTSDNYFAPQKGKGRLRMIEPEMADMALSAVTEGVSQRIGGRCSI